MERSYHLRLPKEASATHGVEFMDSPRNWVDKAGPIREFITAMYPQNSEAGIHASNDRKTSLCGLDVTKAETIDSGTAETVAAKVTCRFCQARLVNAGVLDADASEVSAYARDYGRRRPPTWLPEH